MKKLILLLSVFLANTAVAQPVTTKVPLTTIETSCTAAQFVAGNGSAASPQCGTLTTTGSTGPATMSGGVLNIPQYVGTGGGTVTTVSVASSNGFAGTVANPTSTPAITLSTSITGVLKGNGTAISAASAGTDYQAPLSLTTSGTSGAATLVSNTLNVPQYAGTVTSVTCFGSAITSSGTCVTAGQMPGDTSGSSASSGNVGEYVSSTVSSGSAVSASSGTPGQITSVSLGAGDWDCRGDVQWTASSGAAVTVGAGWVSTSFASLPTGNTSYYLSLGTTYAANSIGAFSLAPMRFVSGSSQTVFLAYQFNFASGSVVTYGQIGCRRMR